MIPTDAYTLLDNENHGTPWFVQWEATLICAMHIALMKEEFTHAEAVALIAAWLSGPRSIGTVDLAALAASDEALAEPEAGLAPSAPTS